MLIEDVLRIVIPVFVAWQVLLPLVRNRPVFPLFRKKTAGQKQLHRAEGRKAEAEDLAEAARVEEQAKGIEEKVNKSRSEE